MEYFDKAITSPSLSPIARFQSRISENRFSNVPSSEISLTSSRSDYSKGSRIMSKNSLQSYERLMQKSRAYLNVLYPESPADSDDHSSSIPFAISPPSSSSKSKIVSPRTRSFNIPPDSTAVTSVAESSFSPKEIQSSESQEKYSLNTQQIDIGMSTYNDLEASDSRNLPGYSLEGPPSLEISRTISKGIVTTNLNINSILDDDLRDIANRVNVSSLELVHMVNEAEKNAIKAQREFIKQNPNSTGRRDKLDIKLSSKSTPLSRGIDRNISGIEETYSMGQITGDHNEEMSDRNASDLSDPTSQDIEVDTHASTDRYFQLSQTLPDDHTSISSVTVSLPSLTNYNKQQQRHSTDTSPFEALEAIRPVSGKTVQLMNDKKAYEAVIETLGESTQDRALRKALKEVADVDSIPSLPIPPTNRTSILPNELSSGMSNSIDYDRSVNSASEWHSNKLPSIRLESDDASSRLSRNNTPSPKRKFPAKKPLYMRVMEEAKRKEEQENQAKERKYKNVKVVKLKVNPSSNEIKEHIKRHDEMFPRRKATSPERGKENIVRSPTNRNKYDQGGEASTKNPAQSSPMSPSTNDGYEPQEVLTKPYLKRKHKIIRLTTKKNQSKIPDKNSKVNPDKQEPSAAVGVDAKRKNIPAPSKRPINKERKNDRPSSQGGLEVDLTLFPHGPDWLSNILRIREEEHKMSEIYEQGFSIMIMELEADRNIE